MIDQELKRKQLVELSFHQYLKLKRNILWKASKHVSHRIQIKPNKRNCPTSDVVITAAVARAADERLWPLGV